MEIKTENWLITGGCGFIGRSLINHLLKKNIIKKNINIRILDNLTVSTKEELLKISSFVEKDSHSLNNSPEGVELIVGDIKNNETCIQCCKGIDIVIHLAANTGVEISVANPRQDMNNNIIGTFNMLDAAKHNKAKKFIFASSSATVGEVEPPIHEKKLPKPISPYGASKLSGEAYCSVYYKTFALNTVVLRFGNVYGPLSEHKYSVIAKFIKNALSGKPIEIYGDGNQTRDFIFIDDLIQAIILAVQSDIGGEVFQIATCTETTVNEIARMIKKILKDKYNNELDIIYSNPRLGDVNRNYSDISKAKNILGYNPKFNIYDGLKKVFDFFNEKIDNKHVF